LPRSISAISSPSWSGAIGIAKNAADPAGHYSRPDVTRLLLNRKRYQRVEQFALPADTVEPADIAAAAS